MTADQEHQDPPPDQLDLETIELMHRGDPRGNVVFTRMDDGEMKQFTSMAVRDLREMLPGFVDQLLPDSFMTVNTFKGKTGRSFRRDNNLSKLHCLYVDLDFYNLDPPLTFDRARLVLFGMVSSGWLPEPSILASSGRGMYVFWLFAEPADPSDKAAWRIAQKQLNDICKRLGADRQAKDTARVLRIPGSYHTAAGKRVSYVVQADQDGQVFAYTFPELAAAMAESHQSVRELHLEGPPPALRPYTPLTLPDIQVARAGNPMEPGCLMPCGLPDPKTRVQTRATNVLREITRLAEDRGGIPTGCRHLFLWRCAGAFRALGIIDRDLFNIVNTMNHDACRPPQNPQEVYAACNNPMLFMRDKNTGKVRFVRNDEYTAEFGVTLDEARRLALDILVPPEECDRREQYRKLQAENHKAARAVRRTWVADKVADADPDQPFPSTRDLAGEFLLTFGTTVSHETMRQDLAHLGYRLDKARHLHRLP